jgi:hypothetical protein
MMQDLLYRYKNLVRQESLGEEDALWTPSENLSVVPSRT